MMLTTVRPKPSSRTCKLGLKQVRKSISRVRFDPAKARGAVQPTLFQPWASEPISVSELTRLIKRAVEDHLPRQVLVAGEISNLKKHTSGHVYLVLKDSQSQIPAVMWKSKTSKMRFQLSDGLAVIATGHVEVYEPQGKYQLIVEKLVPEGLGALELAFKQLKEKLAKEGLFDASVKKTLPHLPRTIALVTSPSGAAIRDMIRTLNRRFPALRILIYPVAVQGSGAAQEIATALGDLDKQSEALGGIDLIILGRGGGSLEDLWAFNEEIVARAIYACQIPIISAVGHETDLTISDLVADVRAATPTAGAELAVPLLSEIVQSLLVNRQRLGRFVSQKIELCRGRLERVLAAGFFRRPSSTVMSQTQRLDELSVRLAKTMTERLAASTKRTSQLERRLSRLAPSATLARAEGRIRTIAQRLRRAMDGSLYRAERSMHQKMLKLARKSPGQLVGLKQAALMAVGDRLPRAIEVINNVQAKRLVAIGARLEAVGPEKVLARGYSITMAADSGEVVRDARQLRCGQELLTRLHKGQVYSNVNKTEGNHI